MIFSIYPTSYSLYNKPLAIVNFCCLSPPIKLPLFKQGSLFWKRLLFCAVNKIPYICDFWCGKLCHQLLSTITSCNITTSESLPLTTFQFSPYTTYSKYQPMNILLKLKDKEKIPIPTTIILSDSITSNNFQSISIKILPTPPTLLEKYKVHPVFIIINQYQISKRCWKC